MEELMLKIEHVSKQYKLGQIGGTTLYHEIKRRQAKRKGLPDPTKKINAKEYHDGELFMALDDVSFDVRKGERVGIIGHNGAGKSTLLKLISRITAPTGGTISMNGRVASMLEVGTGFSAELTGRENIYMNGAILGMTKKEIDAKIEDIIDFSEVREFIDTPVRRYSSGMYVKLAFSVAAHLDSEIMIMDEVLAVGDMAFQKKCLDKMNDVSKAEGRTILYVSHNMNTIRQLCDRCIVLDHGKVVFDGDVEEAIGVYMEAGLANSEVCINLSDKRMNHLPQTIIAKMTYLELIGKSHPQFEVDEPIKAKLSIRANKDINNVFIRFEIRAVDGSSVGAATLNKPFELIGDQETECLMTIQCQGLVPGKYYALLVLYEKNIWGAYNDLDAIWPVFSFSIIDTENKMQVLWNSSMWGRIKFQDINLERAQ